MRKLMNGNMRAVLLPTFSAWKRYSRIHIFRKQCARSAVLARYHGLLLFAFGLLHKHSVLLRNATLLTVLDAFRSNVLRQKQNSERAVTFFIRSHFFVWCHEVKKIRAVKTLQIHWRNYRLRCSIATKRAACVQIQRRWRNHLYRRENLRVRSCYGIRSVVPKSSVRRSE